MGGMFKSKSQTTKSSEERNPWAPAQGDLKNILGEISNWYDDAKDTGYISSTGDLSGIYSQYLNGLNGISSNVQNTTQDMLNQGMSQMQGASDLYNKVGNTQYSAEDIMSQADKYINNDVLDNQINQANKGIYQRLDEQVIPGMEREHLAGGNAGSSRAALQNSLVTRDTNQIATDNAANIRSNAYQSAINTAMNNNQNNTNNMLNGAQGMQSAGNSLFGAGSQYGSAMMSGLAPMLEGAQLQQMIQGAQQADKIGKRDYIADLISQYYLPTVGTIGGMGGTSTGKQQTPGSSMFNSLLSGGAAAGQIYSAFSDPMLKKNIRKLHDVEDGIGYYEWDWNEEGKKLTGEEHSEGLLAQEVKEKYPEFVSVDPGTGYMKVDYSILK